MIAHITGKILSKTPATVVIDVGGVGYELNISSETHSALGKIKKSGTVSLWTYLVARENALDLYGFAEEGERELFEHLIGVSGIGPKSALAVLSLATPKVLRSSIASGDTGYLTKVSGIGKKSAQKIVLELKDKLGVSEDEAVDLKEETDAVEALRSLGYTLKESRDALKKVDDSVEGTSDRVRAALKQLGS